MLATIDSGLKTMVGAWIAPWLMVWIRPRATIRRIVDADPNRLVVGIAWIAGALAALNFEVELSNGQMPPSMPLAAMISSLGSIGLAVFAFVLGLLGVAVVYGLGRLYRWSGHILGGSAQTAEVRAAIAWAQVPALYIIAIGALMAIFGPETSVETAAAARPFSVWAITRAILTLWTVVISLKMLGEVHRFSAWRGLGTIVLGTFAVLFAALGAVVAVMLAVFVGRAFF
jgi:Yip1-like protein